MLVFIIDLINLDIIVFERNGKGLRFFIVFWEIVYGRFIVIILVVVIIGYVYYEVICKLIFKDKWILVILIFIIIIL